uniref:Plasmid pARN4 n=1 Tax=Saccharolobus islandicus TaxID=43080 RepID=Q5W2Q2_SACIS|nr:hypothetical protein [Sulfolobus islandicus]CAG38244.1 hypothetical protein [Sulfolobus islandicus]
MTIMKKLKILLINKLSDIRYSVLGGIGLPGWAKSRLQDEKGSIEWEETGYASKIVVIKLEDPWTDDKNKQQRKTAFVIYFSEQVSKPLTPSQLPWKLNQIYKIVKELRAKGYHTFPALLIQATTPGARKELEKHKVHVFNTLEDLLYFIYNKLVYRLQKLVETAKFTFKFDRIFSFLKTVIEGLGFGVPAQILEEWAYKPRYPDRA